MFRRVCTVHHSGYGHTARQAAAVAEGVRTVDDVACIELTVADLAGCPARMLWVNLNLLPGNNSAAGSVEDLNRLGASLGARAQSNVDQGPEHGPPEADLETARRLGQRAAECAVRWIRE